jgi:hypothetical protein
METDHTHSFASAVFSVTIVVLFFYYLSAVTPVSQHMSVSDNKSCPSGYAQSLISEQCSVIIQTYLFTNPNA